MTAKDHPELTAAAIQKAITALNIFDDLSPCFRIQEGCDHNVWCIGPDIILRGLPATDRSQGKSEASLKRDTAVSQVLRRHMSNSNLIPEVFATITISGWICNLEKRIHGISLHVTHPTARTEHDLVAVLRDLAAVPIEEAKEAVGYEDWRPNMKSRVSKAVRAWDDLRRFGYVDDHSGQTEGLLKRQLAALNKLDDDEEYEPALLHADISGEHILIDDADGAVQGIIDWSDAIVGDPCRDIAGLCLAVGRLMATRIGIRALYSKHTVEKGVLYAMCLATQTLRNRIYGNDHTPEQLLRSEFRRAFQGTGIEQMVH